MKVLMIGNDPSVKGGITSVVTQLLSHDWAAEGIEMKYIPTYVEGPAHRKVLFFAGAYRRIRTCLRRWKPDVVHIHMSYRGSFTRKSLIHRACRRAGVPDLVHLHGSEFDQWYRGCDEKKQARIRRFLREIGGIIVLGRKWEAAIRNIEPRANITVVGNTVKLPETRVAWRGDRFRILYLGVLIPRKGVADLLRAVKLLADRQQLDRCRLVIAGTGAEERHLKELCEELAIGPWVEFAGWTEGEGKRALLESSQLLVLPSYNEGLPISVLEAISYGMPVIATDVGDVSAAVRDGENGFLLRPGDIAGLADRISRVKDPAAFEAMSTASRAIAEADFSDRVYFDTIRSCYLSLDRG